MASGTGLSHYLPHPCMTYSTTLPQDQYACDRLIYVSKNIPAPITITGLISKHLLHMQVVRKIRSTDNTLAMLVITPSNHRYESLVCSMEAIGL